MFEKNLSSKKKKDGKNILINDIKHVFEVLMKNEKKKRECVELPGAGKGFPGKS